MKLLFEFATALHNRISLCKEYLLYYRFAACIGAYIVGLLFAQSNLISFICLALTGILVFLKTSHKIYFVFLLLFCAFGFLNVQIRDLYTLNELTNIQEVQKIEGDIVRIQKLKTGNLYQAKCIKTYKFDSETRCHTLINLISTDSVNETFQVNDIVVAEMDSSQYISSDLNQYYSVRTLSNLGQHKNNFIQEQIDAFRNKMLNLIFQQYSEKEGQILTGLLLGKVIELDQDLEKQFIKSGTIHILVVSGYNVSIIIVLVSAFLARFSRLLRIVISVLLILFFCVLTGGEPPIIRAAIMGIVPLFTIFIGRPTQAVMNLLIAGFLMIIIDPQIISSLSFLLSFLATLGMLLFANSIHRKIKKIPDLVSLNLSTTIAAQILVLPILVYFFHSLSLVSLITNILILDFIPILMFTGAISLVFTGLGFNPMYAITYTLIKYIDVVTKFFANFKFSQIEIPNISPVLIIIFYLLIAITLVEKSFRNQQKNT